MLLAVLHIAVLVTRMCCVVRIFGFGVHRSIATGDTADRVVGSVLNALRSGAHDFGSDVSRLWDTHAAVLIVSRVNLI